MSLNTSQNKLTGIYQVAVSTSGQWASTSKIIPKGVLCFESDTKFSKIADGVRTYTNLPYFTEATLSTSQQALLTNFNQPGGVSVLDSNGLLIASQLPAQFANAPTFVSNISARDAIPVGQRYSIVVVLDAAADPDVGTGTAFYVWSSSASSWTLVGKPTSTDAAIAALQSRATALESEQAAQNTAIGLNTNGTFVSWTSAAPNLVSNSSATSLAASLEIVDAEIGPLASLSTTAKRSIVSAINELLTDINNEISRAESAEESLTTTVTDTIMTSIGTMASLNTSAKTNLVSAINEVLGDVSTETGRAEAAETTLTNNLTTLSNNVGTLSSLNTVSKSTIASAVNEVLLEVQNEVSRAEAAEATINSTIDAKLNGLSWKQAVALMLDGADSQAATQMTGLSTIQGYAIQSGDRIAVNYDGPTPGWPGNGVYIAGEGAWTRSTDMNETTPINEFNDATFYVDNGTYASNPYTQYLTVSTIGTSLVAFTQMNGAKSLTEGFGIGIVGNQITAVGDDTTITVDATGIHVAAAVMATISSNSTAITTETSRAEGVENTISSNIGTLASLTTTTKSTIVGALNEVKTDVNNETSRAEAAEGVLTTDLGDVSTLAVAGATSAVDAINAIAGLLEGDITFASVDASFWA